MTYPSTKRFFIHRDPNRLGVDGKPSRIMEVMFRSSDDAELQEFAHTWDIRGYGPEYDGKYEFNRSDVCIEHCWHPAQHTFNTLEDLLNYCEQNFSIDK